MVDSKRLAAVATIAGLTFLAACSKPAPAAVAPPVDAPPPVPVSAPPVIQDPVGPTPAPIPVSQADAAHCGPVQLPGFDEPAGPGQLSGRHHPGPIVDTCQHAAPAAAAAAAAPVTGVPAAAAPVAAQPAAAAAQ